MTNEIPTPDNNLDKDESIDQAANKLGSYDQARRELGLGHAALPPKTWQEREADGEDAGAMSSARRRAIALNAIGGQLGEDAEPTPDQTRDQAGYDALRQQARPAADRLFEERIARERAAAESRGENPGAIERMLRERRNQQRNQ